MRLIACTILLLAVFCNASAQKVKRKKVKYPNGTYEIFEYVKVNKEIIKTGRYYKSGKIYQVDGTYLNGKRVGNWSYSSYKNEKLEYYTLGHLDSVKYLNKKSVKTIVYLTNGDSVVTNTVISPASNRISKTQVADTAFYYNPDKSLRGLKIQGAKQGNWHFKLSDGNTCKMTYHHDTIIGLTSSYRPDGSLITQYMHDDKGHRQGNTIIFSKNGDTIGIFPYVGGKLQGSGWTKYGNGQVHCKVEYDSNRIKSYREYDLNGSLHPMYSVTDGIGRIRIDVTEAGYESVGIKNGYYHGSDSVLTSSRTQIKTYNNGYLTSVGTSKIDNDTSQTLANCTLSLVSSSDTLAHKVYKAHFVGGNEALDRYIMENFEIPEICYEECPSGTIYLEFIINRNGEIEQLKIPPGFRFGFGVEEAATELVKSTSLLWEPAHQFGVPAKMQFTKPIRLSFN